MTTEDPQAFTREDFIYFFLRGEREGDGGGPLWSIIFIDRHRRKKQLWDKEQ